MKKEKVFYWMDETVDENIIVEPTITPVTENPEGDVPPVVEIDLNKIASDLASLKEMLVVKKEAPPVTVLPTIETIVEPVVETVTPIDISFASIGLTPNQEKTVQAQIQAVVAKSKTSVTTLEAEINKLKADLSVKQTDEASIVNQIQSRYEGTVNNALTQINGLEGQITALAEQLKIKDEIISSKENSEFLMNEITSKPWMEDLVKAQKIKTRDEYLKQCAPLEAREKKIYETTSKFSNSTNIFRGIDQKNTSTVKTPATDTKSYAMDLISKYTSK